MCSNNDKKLEARRNLLKGTLGVGALLALGGCMDESATVQYAIALTEEQRNGMSPDQVIQYMKDGNQRFVDNKMINYDYKAQKRATESGQYPAAIVLSCVDSRAPAEIIMNTGIGDLFNARVAGNVDNPDILGSMEFACAVAGSKVILVMGHTKCGAVKGAIANVNLGNLTGLLDQIKPAIAKTEFTGEKSPENYDYVNAVAKTNVFETIRNIRENSPVLSDLEKAGTIKIVGAMYHLDGGKLEFYQDA